MFSFRPSSFLVFSLKNVVADQYQANNVPRSVQLYYWLKIIVSEGELQGCVHRLTDGNVTCGLFHYLSLFLFNTFFFMLYLLIYTVITLTHYSVGLFVFLFFLLDASGQRGEKNKYVPFLINWKLILHPWNFSLFT